jgi:Fe-S-cluster containining protein
MPAYTTDLPRIGEIKRKAHQGDAGVWRKEFTRQYRQVLEHIFEEIRAETLPVFNSSEEGITCRKGCTHCCEHFVSIPVSHAVLITDYLYSSERALSSFLHGYDKWVRVIEDNPQASAVFSSLEEHTASAAMVKPYSQELLAAYHAFSIPCPFLDRSECAIYPVRPVCCAAYFSVSSPEYCQSDSATPATILEVKPSETNLRKLAELTDPRLSLHQESLPKLVYKLLTNDLPEVFLEIQKLFESQG